MKVDHTYNAGEVLKHPELAAINILEKALHEATKAMAAAHSDLRHFGSLTGWRHPLPAPNRQIWAFLRGVDRLSEAIADYTEAIAPRLPDPPYPF